MNTQIPAESILLWPEGAPEARGDGALDVPMLTVHLPDPAIALGTGIIVNPGGGYRILASDHEGLQVARWLNRQGIAAFVLRYRLGPAYHTEVSLLDGLRAMRLVRSRADDFGLAADRIGMLGFSAGGHLASAVATRWDAGEPDHDDPIERHRSRPDFVVLVYAVTNGARRGRKADEYTPTDERVSGETPPAFIVHTHEDETVPSEQSWLFYRALKREGVQAELHIFGHGEHGVGLATGDPDTGEWTALMLRWIRRIGMLTVARRIEVTGTLGIDGGVPGMFWVTLLPEDASSPIVRVKAHRGDGGRFRIDSSQGPVPGPHRIEVRHLSDIFPHVGSGDYSLMDERLWTGRHEVREGEPLRIDIRGGDIQISGF